MRENLPEGHDLGRKRALTGVASVGILVVTIGVETANAQSYRRYGPARTYTSRADTPQSRGSVRREGVPRTTPFSDRYSPAATAVVALATMKNFRTDECRKRWLDDGCRKRKRRGCWLSSNEGNAKLNSSVSKVN